MKKRLFIYLGAFLILASEAMAEWDLPDFSFMHNMSRGKTYLKSANDHCGLQLWTNTATGLVTLLQKSVDGSNCGAPKVENFSCNQDSDPKKCYKCVPHDALCEGKNDPSKRLVVCKNGDFEMLGVRYSLFPWDSSRATAPCN